MGAPALSLSHWCDICTFLSWSEAGRKVTPSKQKPQGTTLLWVMGFALPTPLAHPLVRWGMAH